jgi:hypothetical protein
MLNHHRRTQMISSTVGTALRRFISEDEGRVVRHALLDHLMLVIGAIGVWDPSRRCWTYWFVHVDLVAPEIWASSGEDDRDMTDGVRIHTLSHQTSVKPVEADRDTIALITSCNQERLAFNAQSPQVIAAIEEFAALEGLDATKWDWV